MDDVDNHQIKLSFRCPLYLLKILKYQSKLSEPYLRVKYMKFRIKYPSGFIGKQALMVRKSISNTFYSKKILDDCGIIKKMIFTKFI